MTEYTYTCASVVDRPQSRNTESADPSDEMMMHVVAQYRSVSAPIAIKPSVAARLNSMTVKVDMNVEVPNRPRTKVGRKIFGR